MASYNLNQALKDKAAASSTKKDDGELHLDDVSRVKVLSPGRQVFKRFIRNRLAVFGTVLLVLMFVFSFFGPLVYPYGQKEIFYKYDYQNVNYALAKANTTFNGYTIDESVEIDTNAKNNMNTNIKTLKASGESELYMLGSDGVYYKTTMLGEYVYTLSRVDTEKVCDFGNTTVFVGTYTVVGKDMAYETEPLGAEFEAALSACKGNSGEFTVGDVTYTYEKASGVKAYSIYANANDAFAYTGAAMDEGFETAAEQVETSGELFTYDGQTYAVSIDGEQRAAYRLGDEHEALVFTSCALDMYEAGKQVSNEFRVNALLAAYGTGSFEADGAAYTIAEEENALIIRDANGAEYADLTDFIIRRYNGDDTMDYELKASIRETIAEMTERREMSGSVTCPLPQQNDAGEYAYDDDGNLLYNDTELRITQKDTGEFVVNCDQIIYKIDIYASPTAAHILGTDGDGFDVLSRIMYGGRISLMVGFVVVFLETFLGVIMGGLAGYYGGWVDNLIMRLVDIFYCLPSMPIMIILGAMMDALRMNTYVRLLIMMAALGIMGWAGVARLVRGQILSLREQEFMVATEATGIRVKDRIFRHLVPNVMPQLIVIATMGMGSVILTESTLSFLGLGVKHPLATWGTIINSVSSASAMAHYAYIWIPVGLLICLTVIAFNFVGDGLRDAYDPKSKR